MQNKTLRKTNVLNKRDAICVQKRVRIYLTRFANSFMRTYILVIYMLIFIYHFDAYSLYTIHISRLTCQ